MEVLPWPRAPRRCWCGRAQDHTWKCEKMPSPGEIGLAPSHETHQKIESSSLSSLVGLLSCITEPGWIIDSGAFSMYLFWGSRLWGRRGPVPASAPIVAEADLPGPALPRARPQPPLHPGEDQASGRGAKPAARALLGTPPCLNRLGIPTPFFFSFKKKSPHHLALGLVEIWGTQFDRDLARTLTLLVLA